MVAFHSGLPLTGGDVGVDVCFALSGFVIGGLRLRETDATGRVRLGELSSRRVRRLLPALATMSVVTLLVSVVVLSPDGTQQAAATTAAAASLSVSDLQRRPIATAVSTRSGSTPGTRRPARSRHRIQPERCCCWVTRMRRRPPTPCSTPPTATAWTWWCGTRPDAPCWPIATNAVSGCAAWQEEAPALATRSRPDGRAFQLDQGDDHLGREGSLLLTDALAERIRRLLDHADGSASRS